MIGQQQEGSTITQIMDMKKQGLSNNQIIQNMQRAGFTNSQIFDAMNQLETKNAVDNMVPMNQIMSDGSAPFPPGGGFPPSPGFGNQAPPPNPARDQIARSDSNVKTEELIEAIIDEKWSDLITNVQKILEWKNRAEARISALEMKIENLKDSFDQLHKAVIGKISDYDAHILDVGTEIKAMEKVFSKVLPSFTENVHELTKITEDLKRGIK